MSSPKPAFKTTQCNITRQQFLENAKPLEVTIEGLVMEAQPKEFSTGSFGYGTQGKLTIKLDGKLVKVQVSMNFTVIGSKEAQ